MTWRDGVSVGFKPDGEISSHYLFCIITLTINSKHPYLVYGDSHQILPPLTALSTSLHIPSLDNRTVRRPTSPPPPTMKLFFSSAAAAAAAAEAAAKLTQSKLRLRRRKEEEEGETDDGWTTVKNMTAPGIVIADHNWTNQI